MTILEEFRQLENRVLDRLVDGELSPDDRRELLAALDDEPGGWRCCALAFLEAQSWRWQLSRLAAEPLVAQASAASPRTAVRRSRGSLLGWCLAMAASLFVAFLLGNRFANRDTAPNALAENQPSAPAASGVEAMNVGEGAASEEGDDEAPPWETVTLASADGGEIQLRALNSDDASDEAAWAAASQSSVSARLLRELEAAGWEVNRQRRLVPIDLSDGRRMIVPVEEVDIRYPEVAQF